MPRATACKASVDPRSPSYLRPRHPCMQHVSSVAEYRVNTHIFKPIGTELGKYAAQACCFQQPMLRGRMRHAQGTLARAWHPGVLGACMHTATATARVPACFATTAVLHPPQQCLCTSARAQRHMHSRSCLRTTAVLRGYAPVHNPWNNEEIKFLVIVSSRVIVVQPRTLPLPPCATTMESQENQILDQDH